MATTPHSQGREPGFNPWPGNQIPHGTAKGSQAVTKTSAAKRINTKQKTVWHRLVSFIVSEEKLKEVKWFS